MLYYQHHIGDYLRDTAHLTLLEHGAYRMLLDLYYQKTGSLPSDVEEICRLLRCRNNGERQAVERVLKEFFVYESGIWKQSRCDKEIQEILKKSEKARQKANKRWHATALPQQCQSNASRYPLSNKAFDLDNTVTTARVTKTLKPLNEMLGAQPAQAEQPRKAHSPERAKAIAESMARNDHERARALSNHEIDP
jgi:uncharacterized protein YdaU (DUF1376 family)